MGLMGLMDWMDLLRRGRGGGTTSARLDEGSSTSITSSSPMVFLFLGSDRFAGDVLPRVTIDEEGTTGLGGAGVEEVIVGSGTDLYEQPFFCSMHRWQRVLGLCSLEKQSRSASEHLSH